MSSTPAHLVWLAEGFGGAWEGKGRVAERKRRAGPGKKEERRGVGGGRGGTCLNIRRIMVFLERISEAFSGSFLGEGKGSWMGSEEELHSHREGRGDWETWIMEIPPFSLLIASGFEVLVSKIYGKYVELTSLVFFSLSLSFSLVQGREESRIQNADVWRRWFVCWTFPHPDCT